MRDDALRERFRDCNPWWRAATTGGDALAWVASDRRAEARVIKGKFSAGVVATRTVLDLSNPAWALPAPVLALLLE